MVVKKPRIVIIGAGIAGLAAANMLYSSSRSKDMFELCVVEGGSRIGGRINTAEFCGERIEMGATWIHGIEDNPIYEIASTIRALESDQPWEGMDKLYDKTKTVAEGGLEIDPSVVDFVSTFFNSLMDFAQGNFEEKSLECSQNIQGEAIPGLEVKVSAISARNSTLCDGKGKLSMGRFLKNGLRLLHEPMQPQEESKCYGGWSNKLLEEAVFAIYENVQRTSTAAGDLMMLDFDAEREYRLFPGEEITIAKGYLSIVKSLELVLPQGMIQLGKKVEKIEWHPLSSPPSQVDDSMWPVKLRFSDGSVMNADHIIITVSLGVLKAGTAQSPGMFCPPLPQPKIDAISKLGYGVVNKLFMRYKSNGQDEYGGSFPFLQLAFHRPDSDSRRQDIPWWIRRTSSLQPIHKNSNVLLSWLTGDEARAIEDLSDLEIIDGLSTTLSYFSPGSETDNILSRENCSRCDKTSPLKFTKILRSQWANDPLFMGSYSYIALGSSGDDVETLSEPLPSSTAGHVASDDTPPLQLMFAGEATHKTHYSTTHGAYFSGIREATRLLQHYHCL